MATIATGLAMSTLACQKEAKRQAPVSIGETFSFGKSVGGVEWECTLLAAENLGKKLSRTAVLSGETTKVGLAPTLATNHFERLHLKITNRGHSSGTMSPSVLTMDVQNPDLLYARTVLDQTTAGGYLDAEATPPFNKAGFKPVEPGETREYWDITEVPDAQRVAVVEWGLSGDSVRFLVKLGP